MLDGLKFLKWLAWEINILKDRLLISVIRRYWPKAVTPNMISWFRITLSPVIIAMCFAGEIWRIWIIITFSIWLAADLLDGATARAFNMMSKRGMVLDPLADKLLTIPLFIFLIKDNKPLLFSLVGLECLLACSALASMFLKIESPSNIFGKWKLTFQASGILALLIFGNTAWAIGILWISLGLAIGSILGHIQDFLSEKPIRQI